MLDLTNKPIVLAKHVIRRVKQRSAHNLAKRYPDISVINDLRHNVEKFTKHYVNSQNEIRVFAKGNRQYRIVEETDCYKVVTMIQHNKKSAGSEWKSAVKKQKRGRLQMGL